MPFILLHDKQQKRRTLAELLGNYGKGYMPEPPGSSGKVKVVYDHLGQNKLKTWGNFPETLDNSYHRAVSSRYNQICDLVYTIQRSKSRPPMLFITGGPHNGKTSFLDTVVAILRRSRAGCADGILYYKANKKEQMKDLRTLIACEMSLPTRELIKFIGKKFILMVFPPPGNSDCWITDKGIGDMQEILNRCPNVTFLLTLTPETKERVKEVLDHFKPYGYRQFNLELLTEAQSKRVIKEEVSKNANITKKTSKNVSRGTRKD
eukprot:UN23621